MRKRIILVTGATGRQGGATLRHLVKDGWSVRALTRDPSQPKAQALAAQGVEVVRGDLDDRASLVAACMGVYGVFSVQDPWLHGVEREIVQGKMLADVAKVAGVQHFVYASVATAERKTGVPHFESKGEIERHIEGISLKATFLRPVFFMDMLLPQFDSRSHDIWGALWRGLGAAKPIQLIAVDDIGAVAAKAFAKPEVYVGQAIDLVGESLTMSEVDAIYRRVFGKAPRVRTTPFWLMRILNREAEVNFRWIGEQGWHVDLAGTEARVGPMMKFEPWLRSVA